MKRVLFLILFIPASVYCQVTDHFYDMDFNQNPAWTGDSNHFEINNSHQLHLSSSGSGISYLSTQNERVINSEWSFWSKISFNTSSNNYARVYLASDSSNLEGPLHGYFIQLGGSDDSISIMTQSGSISEKLYSFRHYLTDHSTNIIGIKIRCDCVGNWEVFIDTTGGINYISDGSFFDSTHRVSHFFGVYCKYTSSNATKIYFDNFYVGPVLYDTFSPFVTSNEVIDSIHFMIVFSEPMKRPGIENPENYLLKSREIHPIQVVMDAGNPTIIQLYFSPPITNGSFDSLIITGVQDLAGNAISDTLLPVCYHIPAKFDVVVHEILSDPDPQIGLPVQEYVELYNRTDYPIRMHNWAFNFGNSQKIMPDITIDPRGYLLLVKDSSWFGSYGKCTPLFTSEYSLSNEGSTLILKDNREHVIHAITYSSDWFNHSFKEEGGWSLEMIDPKNPCGCEENWKASIDASGGTPGRVNSVAAINPDEISPSAERAIIQDSLTIELFFSEPLDSSLMVRPEFWQRLPNAQFPTGIYPKPPFYCSVRLSFDRSFQQGNVYTIQISDSITDCVGNMLETNSTIRVARPDSIGNSDVVINELLFNPVSGGSRFLEIFNRSFNVVDIGQLVMITEDTLSGEIRSDEPITEGQFLLFPSEYLVLSLDPKDICSRYSCLYPKGFIQVESFPALDENSGNIILARKNDGTVIDRFNYDRQMHYPLLVSEEGVSLERLSPERGSGDPGNWHSASETAGFATPGYQNSQQMSQNPSESVVSLFPPVFTPDNDGKDDVLNISFHLEEPGYQVSVTVFDTKGRQVRRLVNNVLSSIEDGITWDGMDDHRNKAGIGFYILYIELVNPDGMIRNFKKPVVVGANF